MGDKGEAKIGKVIFLASVTAFIDSMVVVLVT